MLILKAFDHLLNEFKNSIKNAFKVILIGFILIIDIEPMRIGIPGLDFPAYSGIPPNLHFFCGDRNGFFADTETNCQIWHWCVNGRSYTFLCPNGTLFNQDYRICDWWYNVDCKRFHS